MSTTGKNNGTHHQGAHFDSSSHYLVVPRIMVGPRVSFGGKTVEVPSEGLRSGKTAAVVPPAPDGDGTVFVSIVSYRDGERCGDTIKSIFESAANPENVVVGVVEQNSPDDSFCLEQYCKKYGFETIKRLKVREGVTKILVQPDEQHSCPRYDQVRLIAFHDLQAKGPTFSRSLVHHVLGNEEYCLQIDAHSRLAPSWDVLLKQEWKKIGNEFAVLSSIPPSLDDMNEFLPTGLKAKQVPRQCVIKHRDNGVPDYDTITENSFVTDLEKPLLSHGWSAAYSFSKCHLEESVPYDPFSHWAMPTEQFVRYARMWTRGYDTYTPTRNYLFHDYGRQDNGHGDNEWFHRQKQRFRLSAIRRAKKILSSLEEDLPESNLANLGLYGLGKRRSLEQLERFTNVNLKLRTDNIGPKMTCLHGSDYVPYDKSISPMANLYDEPANLDPQPEYPLRTNLVFAETTRQGHKGSLLDDTPVGAVSRLAVRHSPLSKLPSASLLFILWLFGLVLWCLLFFRNPPVVETRATNVRKSRRSRPANKRVHKDV